MLIETNQLVSGVPDNDTLGGARVAGRPQLFLAQPSPNSKKEESYAANGHGDHPDFVDGGDDEPSHLAASVPAGGNPLQA
jgi:hypothetical protein